MLSVRSFFSRSRAAQKDNDDESFRLLIALQSDASYQILKTRVRAQAIKT